MKKLYECGNCGISINLPIPNFCPSCGHKLEKSDEVGSSDGSIVIKKAKLRNTVLVTLIIIFIILIGFFTIPIPYTQVTGFTVSEPYSTNEGYTEWVNSNNCDVDSSCVCEHKGWLGFGSCDSCRCYRTRTVTRYKDVEKEKTERLSATPYEFFAKKVQYYKNE